MRKGKREEFIYLNDLFLAVLLGMIVGFVTDHFLSVFM